MLSLLAVHISEGILNWPWRIGGGLITIAVVAAASRRIRDEEIPRIALLTAAFFVASSIRVSVGPTSVHLVLNGLVGMMLGYRAALAILSGLVLHFALMGHGGFTPLGVNFCVMTFPALLARRVYRCLRADSRSEPFPWRNAGLAVLTLLLPYLLLPIAVGIILLHRSVGSGREMTSSFRAGFITGLLCVLLTAILNGIALWAGGIEDWHIIAGFVVAAHIPVALIEGIILGFAASFLERVKPELLSDNR